MGRMLGFTLATGFVRSAPAGARSLRVRRSGAIPAVANQAVVTRNARTPLVAKTVLPLERKEALIAEAAYYLSESRGFLPGNEQADWAEAELRVNARYRFV